MTNNRDYLLLKAYQAGLTDPRELAAFMGQVDVESGGFASMEENLNYSGRRLLQVFPGRNGIDTLDEANAVARGGAQSVANAIYGGAWGRENLGNAGPNDGWDFRGRGYIQLTGRDNYTRAAREVGMDLVNQPDMVADRETAADIALHYWNDRVVARGHQLDVRQATRDINGGNRHLRERMAAVARWESALTAEVMRGLARGEVLLPAAPGQRQDAVDPLVRQTQENLNTLRVTDAEGRSLTTDGDYGPATKQAIEAFQQQYGLPVDGKVTPQLLTATQIAVSVNEAVHSAQQLGQRYGMEPITVAGWPGVPHAVPRPSAVTRPADHASFADVRSSVASTELLGPPRREPAAPSPTIAPSGLDRATVEALQQNLNSLGFTDVRGRPLADDGRYGPNTHAAVAAFQHEQGLPATGLADRTTLSAVNAHVIVANLQQQKTEREREERFLAEAQAYDGRMAAPVAPSHHDPLGRDTATVHAAWPNAAGIDTLRGTYAPPFVAEVTRPSNIPVPRRAADAIDHNAPGQSLSTPPNAAAAQSPAADWTRHDPRKLHAEHYATLKDKYPQFSEEQLTAYAAAIHKAGIPVNEPLYKTTLWPDGTLNISTAKAQYPRLSLDTNAPVPTIPESAQSVMIHDQQRQAELEQHRAAQLARGASGPMLH
ncbi:MAG TPA: peptidoglycan-binding protein [Lysobacter sp.]